MAGLPRGQLDVGLAFDAYGFVENLKPVPTRWCLILCRIVGLDAFKVEVLHIGARVGETPGQMIGLPNDHRRESRHRGTRHLQAGCIQPHQVPQCGRRKFQMRVVGQQRLAAFGVLAGNHPVVGADALDARFGRGQQGLFAQISLDPQSTKQRCIVGRGQGLFPCVRWQQLVDARYRQGQ